MFLSFKCWRWLPSCADKECHIASSMFFLTYNLVRNIVLNPWIRFHAFTFLPLKIFWLHDLIDRTFANFSRHKILTLLDNWLERFWLILLLFYRLIMTDRFKYDIFRVKFHLHHACLVLFQKLHFYFLYCDDYHSFSLSTLLKVAGCEREWSMTHSAWVGLS